MTRTRLSLSLLLAALLAPAGAAAQDFDAAGEQAMLARINAMRAAQNLTPLIRHPGLDAAARAHSSDMATQQQLTHVSDSSGTPADRVRAAGISASTVSENVALHRTAAQAHEALLGSDAHRANMMAADVTHVGLAALRTERGVYVTQVFAAIGTAAPEAEPEPEPEPDVAPELPEPSTELVEQPDTPTQTQVRQDPIEEPQAAPSPPANQNLQVQQGTNGTVVLVRESGQLVAYWVYGNGRWWYYPYPEGAQPGQRLQPDLSVQGPPPGFPEHPGGAAAPQPRTAPVPPPPQRRGGRVMIRPFAGRVQVAPGTSFYAVPPPPLVGPPTRAWRRAYRRWERDRRRWQRQQERLRRRAM